MGQNETEQSSLLLPPKADVRADVPVGIFPPQQNPCLFDHLVSQCQQLVGNFEAKRFRGLEVDHQFILGRVLHRQLGRLLALEDARVASEPEALLQVLTNTLYRFKRIGLEAGPLSQWLYSVLAEAGLPVICVETRHMRAALKAQIIKTDRNDARGIAQIMRVDFIGRCM